MGSNKFLRTWISDHNKLTAFAAIVAAFAAVAAVLISIWQGYQLNRTLEISLAETRPILTLDIQGSSRDLNKIKFIVRNSGPIPARIVQVVTKPWVNNETRNQTNSSIITIVTPTDEEVVHTLSLKGDLPMEIIKGNKDFRFSIAVLYESTTLEDSRKWLCDLWLVYSTKKNDFAIKLRDEKELTNSKTELNLTNLQPSDWLSWQP